MKSLFKIITMMLTILVVLIFNLCKEKKLPPQVKKESYNLFVFDDEYKYIIIKNPNGDTIEVYYNPYTFSEGIQFALHYLNDIKYYVINDHV